MVSTTEFNDLIYKIFPIILNDMKELSDYILHETNLKMEDVEVLIRDILERALSIIKDWIKKHYNVKDSAFRNFSSLDSLLYHEDGWTLHSSIKNHFDAYNKWRNKSNLINALTAIVATEAQRLPITTFDELVQKLDLFEFVIIYGEAACGQGCSQHFGTYRVGIDKYTLPPYHPARWYIDEHGHAHFVPACKCKATYCDVDNLDEEELADMEYEDLEEWGG